MILQIVISPASISDLLPWLAAHSELADREAVWDALVSRVTREGTAGPLADCHHLVPRCDSLSGCFWSSLLGRVALGFAGCANLDESADQLVWSALKWRLLITVLLIILSPRRADLRLLAIDDADAGICFRWVAIYLVVIPLYPFLMWVIERLGFGRDAVFGVTLFLGLAITAYKIAMFWAIRYPIARTLLAATGQEPRPIRRVVAARGTGSLSPWRLAYT
jgi:hypothetical protein